MNVERNPRIPSGIWAKMRWIGLQSIMLLHDVPTPQRIMSGLHNGTSYGLSSCLKKNKRKRRICALLAYILQCFNICSHTPEDYGLSGYKGAVARVMVSRLAQKKSSAKAAMTVTVKKARRKGAAETRARTEDVFSRVPSTVKVASSVGAVVCLVLVAVGS